MKSTRFGDDPDEVAELGMDIGDYDYIDKLYRCPVVDWVKQGKVQKQVKNQHNCGSCWSFSTIATLENLYARYNDLDDQEDVPSFSEQHLLDCTGLPNLGCFGGKQIYSFNYTLNNGLMYEKDYPYTDSYDTCKYNPEKKAFGIDGFKAYNHLIQHDLEKLVCQGVVGVPMRINDCIKHYHSGIIDDREGLCGCS